jgi:hypothetical protein
MLPFAEGPSTAAGAAAAGVAAPVRHPPHRWCLICRCRWCCVEPACRRSMLPPCLLLKPQHVPHGTVAVHTYPCPAHSQHVSKQHPSHLKAALLLCHSQQHPSEERGEKGPAQRPCCDGSTLPWQLSRQPAAMTLNALPFKAAGLAKALVVWLNEWQPTAAARASGSTQVLRCQHQPVPALSALTAAYSLSMLYITAVLP